ncbi:hypothetical protein FJT64_025831 [Amphibalanus amphitrite]|uniref:Uncharacterized protein n=1 Tax=Amphibalanus amphitrite TaxID=1232801 RepID=A0A6A4WEQ8_AMPAM|nr:hypothetical protein FJT64_025831 [Amphibalanus amphitrite]
MRLGSKQPVGRRRAPRDRVLVTVTGCDQTLHMDAETSTEAATGAARAAGLHWADWVVVVIYFGLVLAVGLLCTAAKHALPTCGHRPLSIAADRST